MKAERTLSDDLLDLHRKADALMSRKWITLQGAREHMLSHLLPHPRGLTREEAADAARAIYGKETTTEFGNLVAHADRVGRSILIRAFAVGDLPTRGIEHLADAGMELHDPLPLVWWHRVVDRADNTSAGDEHPFHFPLWIEGAIQRRGAGRSHEALAAITNVEVSYDRLLELAKLTPRAQAFSDSILASHALREEMMRRKQHGGDHSAATMQIWLKDKFRTLSRDKCRKLIQGPPPELRADRGAPSKRKSSQD